MSARGLTACDTGIDMKRFKREGGGRGVRLDAERLVVNSYSRLLTARSNAVREGDSRRA